MEVKLGKYQHHKGGIMEVIGTALHSETMEELVVYKHVTGERAGEQHFWVRPVSMFMENVKANNSMIPRFRYLEK